MCSYAQRPTVTSNAVDRRSYTFVIYLPTVIIITCEVFIPGCSLYGETLDVMSTLGGVLNKLDDVLSIELFVVRTACTDNMTNI